MKKLNCIMLIDDNDDDNFFHRIIIKEADAADRVIVAENGEEALDYLQKETITPDLIFLDINMPRMNGWEFLEQYVTLASKLGIHPVIIMLTTSINPADESRAQTIREINGFETKPLTEDMLERITMHHFSGADEEAA